MQHLPATQFETFYNIEPLKNVTLTGFLSEEHWVVFSLLVPSVDLCMLITLFLQAFSLEVFITLMSSNLKKKINEGK